MTLLAAIEAGGTKFVCAVSDLDLNIIERISIPTTVPEETMEAVRDFFKQYEVEAFGIGSFGPIDVNEQSPTYGYITSTPKPSWGNYDFVGFIKEAFGKPVYWTTDVNAAAYGEYQLGAAQGTDSSIYLTVGTGIGGGAIVNGAVHNGLNHPEMGHILLKRHPEDSFQGSCPYHQDCLEGLASGTAIGNRVAVKASELSADDPAWQYASYYIAQALMNYSLVLAPERIILGGGVMKQAQMLGLIQDQLVELLNGYLNLPKMEDYIQLPKLGDNAGVVGCLLLAKELID